MEVGWAVSTDNHNEDFLDGSRSQPEGRDGYRAAGFAGSAVLHGLALCVVLMVAQHGMQTARSGLLSVPVELDLPNPELRAGEKSAASPQQVPVPDCYRVHPTRRGRQIRDRRVRRQASDAGEASPA